MFPDNFLKWLFIILIIVSFMLGLTCSKSGPVRSAGGSGSEAPNSVTLVSMYGHIYGLSKPDLSVGVYKQCYVPYNDSGFDITTLSDKNGLFDFGHLDSGTYNVLVNDASFKTSVFFAGIDVGDNIGPDTFLSSLDSVGSIAGIVQDTAGTALLSLPVYIPGSPFFEITDTNGYFVLGNLPSGDFKLLSKEIIRQRPGRNGNQIFIVDTVFIISKGTSLNLGILILK